MTKILPRVKVTRPMTPDRLKREMKRIGGIIVGAAIYAAFVNLFVVPAGFYTGGILGLCQVIRTVLANSFGISFGFDIAGILYYILNIPLMIIAFRMVGRVYFVKTLIAITAETIFLTIIPIPANPILVSDPLAACLIGGLGAGFGCGFLLRMGSSDGGMNLAGALLMKKRVNISVGDANNALNAVVYIIMFFLFNIQVVIYSAIYAIACALMIDRSFSQSINVEVHIICKKDDGEMCDEIFEKIGRGITKWTAIGAYTGNEKDMFYILINKYELNHLVWIVRKYDQDAMIVSTSGVQIHGNFEKRIE